jgi:hypothetical protein
MHLVKVNLSLGFGQVEEMATNVGQLNRLMGQFPFAILLWFDRGAKSSAEDLVSEAYSCEANVGAVCPNVYYAISYCRVLIHHR